MDTESQIIQEPGDQDARDMQRMGKQQLFKREMNSWTLFFLCSNATQVSILGPFFANLSLINGGPPGLLYTTIWIALLFIPVVLSMADMNSLAPTAGSQYHWVSVYAPRRIQQLFSYLIGWVSTLAWQAGCASGNVFVAILAQIIISICKPEYAPAAWHTYLFICASATISAFGNLLGTKMLARFQKWVFVLFLPTWILLNVFILFNAPKATSTQVWTKFDNRGGWPNLALALGASQSGVIGNFLGFDTASHMSEEVRCAARIVPRIMVWTFCVNGSLIFLSLVNLCYHLPDLDTALEEPSGFAYVYLIRQSIPRHGQIAIFSLILVLFTAGNISYQMAASRDLFAFARDGGFILSSYLSRVPKKPAVPVWSIVFTTIFSCLFSLIYLGSSVAFFAITFTSLAALQLCYASSIGCFLYRHIKSPNALQGGFLGRYRKPIYLAGAMVATWNFFWQLWPTSYPVTTTTINWASVMIVGGLMLGAFWYYLKGRKSYYGPVCNMHPQPVWFTSSSSSQTHVITQQKDSL